MKRAKSDENKPERKTIEKNRRNEMKALCNELVSLIPDHHFSTAKEFLSQQDQVEQSVSYIKILRERTEELRRRKTQALMNRTKYDTKNNIISESNLPILTIKDLADSALEVVLISRPNKIVKLHQIISIIEQGGAEVVTVSISNVGDKIIHTLHAQAKVARIGVDISRISERIHKLIS